ncbi:CHAP domain-containing protein [Spongiactinospora sp. TRM90649]|uniref:CHAP domain-containing protein n=1 Tax=Spongiactinospora sp. TRM90649 TaxID=3031114 RepID=UPI0023F629A0|nr:CHAP domain-containing protein [Spongiactinospora sp. TRM90649]MDF5753955.1 CHAP domain-containing protein [Spongiactinospora sp. TRM90649]
MSPETEKFIKLLEKQLGYAEKSGGHTKFGAWYNSVESDADYSAQPWCDMYLSWAAKKLGYEDWIGQFAWTPAHARWFEKQGAWGTTPKKGALVFYDWSGGKSIRGIDHVGVVTGVRGDKILTIEGNIDGGVAKRKKRDQDKVVGYGYPEKVKEALEAEREPQGPPDSVLGTAGESGTAAAPYAPLTTVVPELKSGLISPGPLAAPRPWSGVRPSDKARAGESRAQAKGANKTSQANQASQPTAKPSEAPRPATATRDKPSAAPRATTPPVDGKGTATDLDSVVARGPSAHLPAPTPASEPRVLPDTTPLTAAPLSATYPLQGALPDLSSPVLLAPVLLAALGLLAHSRGRRLRVARPAVAASPSLPGVAGALEAAEAAQATGHSVRRPANGRRPARTPGRHAARPGTRPALETTRRPTGRTTRPNGLGDMGTPELPAHRAARHGRPGTNEADIADATYQGRRRRTVLAAPDTGADAPAPRGRRHRPAVSGAPEAPADFAAAPLRGRRHRPITAREEHIHSPRTDTTGPPLRGRRHRPAADSADSTAPRQPGRRRRHEPSTPTWNWFNPTETEERV